MKNLSKRTLGGIMAASLVLGAWGHGVLIYAVTPVSFTANNPLGGAPVGWGYAGNKFVGSILGDGTNRLYSTDLTGGNIQAFGGTVSLAASYGTEHYVSSSLGLGGFPSRDVYVASGNNIQHLTNAGVADPGLFISGSSGGLIGDVRGISFDAVGTFNYDMLVTTHAGYVYKVDSAGNPTQIGSMGEDTEGLDIAPLGPGAHWGALNGSLFVASEGSGKIRAIDPITLAVTTVATVPSGEELDFVPLNLGTSGNAVEGFYAADYSFDVVKAGPSQFAGMLGDIIVTGETNSTIFRVSAVNTVSAVGSFLHQPEDGLFVTPDVIGAPEPASLALLGLGGLVMLGRGRGKRE